MNFVEIMATVLSTEAFALNEAAKRLEEDQVNALHQLFLDITAERGHLVFCGVGKSGLVGKKLAATFTSLGLPSHFLHPTEALHGDLGTLRSNDALVLISYSGKSEEVLKLFPYIKVPKQRRIALVGDVESPIAQASGIVFDCQVHKEACINNQAPTTSSTLTMAMGDAMAVVYETMAGLSKEDFAQFHPGGKLGKSLRLKVSDLMVGREGCGVLKEESTLKEAILKLTEFPLGAVVCLGDNHQLKGLIVEGDIRRLLSNDNFDPNKKISEIMNTSPVTISSDELASRALELMEKRERPFSLLPVTHEGEFLGILRLHDLFKEGL